MTESEAKQLWCPFVRVGAYTDVGPTAAITVNRDPRDEVQRHCNCIASACMMWVWDAGNPRDSKSKGGITLPESEWPGHCGLAGK